MSAKKITIGTRGSQLALWQAHFTKKQLEELGHEVELQIIKTKGDKIQHQTFDKMEGKGFFTKELEDALLSGEIDMAVHSYKDLPTENPEGLILAANSYRENPLDWLLINRKATDKSKRFALKEGMTVGTSSPRRASQLLHFRPDLKIVPIRGNVPTRVKKLETEVDAVVLAAAGLQRLDINLDHVHKEILDPLKMIPAPAQGVLAFQCRETDTEMQEILQKIHDSAVEQCIAIERKILNKLEGGCQQPIGIYCEVDEATKDYLLWAAYSKAIEGPLQRIFLRGSNPENLTEKAITLLKQIVSKKIFITRDLDQNASNNELFDKSLTKFGHQVTGLSLIDFKSVPFELPNEIDYLFFSSKRGVRFFFENHSEPEKLHLLFQKGLKIAAIGAVTAAAVEAMGFRCDFIGSTKSIETTAQEFAPIAKGKKVVFPQASTSQQSIQQAIQAIAEVSSLVVYDNVAKTDFIVPESDILVFTSPMNVTTYLNQKKIAPNQEVVAIGPTTAKALKDAGQNNYRLPYAFDLISLADVCY